METSERLTRLETEFSFFSANITEIKADLKDGARKAGAVEAKLDSMHSLLEGISKNMCTKVERAELGAKIDGLEKVFSTKLDGFEREVFTKLDGLGKEISIKIDGINTTLDKKIDGVGEVLADKPSVDKVEAMIANARLQLMLGIPVILGVITGLAAFIYKYLHTHA